MLREYIDTRKLRRFWKKRLNFSFLPILEVYKLSAFSRLRIRHSPMRMRMRLVSLKRAPLLTSDLGCKHSTSKRPTQFPPVSNLQIFIHLSFPLEELRSLRKIHGGDQSREISSDFWSLITAAIVPPYIKEQPLTTAIDRKKENVCIHCENGLRCITFNQICFRSPF